MGKGRKEKLEEMKKINTRKYVLEVARCLCHTNSNREGRSVLIWHARRIWKEHRGAGTCFPYRMLNSEFLFFDNFGHGETLTTGFCP